MKSAKSKNSTAVETKKSTTSTWKFGNIFAKNNNSTITKEDTGKSNTAGTKETLHWTEKVKGLNTNDKVKVLETELKTLEEELKDKRETIKCLRELGSGVSLTSSAADFHKIKDKECRQLIEDTQAHYRELEDLNQTVISDVNSRCDSPVPPVADLIPKTNKSNNSDGHAFVAKGNPKLANIRWNWTEHNLRILDLNNRLKIAYDYIKKQNGRDSISAKNVPTTERAPSQKEHFEPALWHVPEGKGVGEKQKNALLALAGDADSDSDEDVYKAAPAKSFYAPPSQIDKAPVSTMMIGKNYTNTYEKGQEPDWLDKDGEIHIKPVQAVFINSLHDKFDKRNENSKNTSYRNSIGEPKIVPSAAQSRNQSTSQFNSQYSPATKLKANDSDVSDDDDTGKISSPGNKAYNWSNYHPQSSYTTSSLSSSRAQNTSGTINSYSYRNEPVTIGYVKENQGNSRQATNSNDSDVD
nr:hypothetical transcript [Hymenolepis microstoma]